MMYFPLAASEMSATISTPHSPRFMRVHSQR